MSDARTRLILQLMEGESLLVGDNVRVLLKEVGRKRRRAVQLVIEAPRDVKLWRVKLDEALAQPKAPATPEDASS